MKHLAKCPLINSEYISAIINLIVLLNIVKNVWLVFSFNKRVQYSSVLG